MVTELARLTIKPDAHLDFLDGVRKARPLFLKARGCQNMSVARSVENPDQYYLTVEWDTIEDHVVTFRNSPEFLNWRELVGPSFSAPPEVEHLEGLDLSQADIGEFVGGQSNAVD